MARVDWAIPCRYAEENGGLGTIVGAGIDTVFVPEVPGMIGLLIALRIVLADDELAEEHTLEFKLYDPAMAEVGSLSGQFTAAPSSPDKEPGWESGIIVPTAHQFEVSEYGTYSLEVSLDNRSQKTIPINVREPPSA